jgi:hypothetical protein
VDAFDRLVEATYLARLPHTVDDDGPPSTRTYDAQRLVA